MSGSFGVTEEVSFVDALRQTLESYPFSNSLLREILQNSDDAHARTQTFILDKRTHTTENLAHQVLGQYVGPALLACNDGVFAEQDWQAILKLNVSSKSDDLSKSGKFGLGFRSTYHLTDSPQILSDDRACIFPQFERNGL
jgi:hypothetical protein